MAKNTWMNHSHESFAIFDSKATIVGIFPLHRIHYKRYRFLKQSNLDSLGGWLCSNENIEGVEFIFQEYKRRLKSCRNNLINFATASLAYDEDPFFLHGISSYTARISVLELSVGMDAIWSNIRKGHKADIKKAQRHGVTFKKASLEDLDVYYDMHEQVCRKSSLVPHNKQYFEFIFKEAMPRNHAFVGIAYHEGNPVAAVNYGIYKDKAVYWTGASYEAAYKLGANHFLHWQMIQDLYSRGIIFLDMGEVFFQHSLSKIQGIVDFKRGFGGDLRPCFKSIGEKN
jgi:hypothetical protein